MALVSLLALAGVFGERAADRRASDGSLRLNVQFPNRLRYRQRMTLEASVTNTRAGAVTGARIRVDPQYLDRFSGVSLAPHADPFSEMHRVGLADLPQVQWAILETSGTITIVPHPAARSYMGNLHADAGAQGI